MEAGRAREPVRERKADVRPSVAQPRPPSKASASTYGETAQAEILLPVLQLPDVDESGNPDRAPHSMLSLHATKEEDATTLRFTRVVLRADPVARKATQIFRPAGEEPF